MRTGLRRGRAAESGAAGPGDAKFESRGAVFVCGPSALAIAAGRELARTQRALVCTSDFAPGSLDTNPAVMTGRVARIDGHLGRFRIKVCGKDSALIDLGPFSPNADGCFDLVLDLNAPPLLATALPPPGYYAPGADPDPSAAIAAAILDLRQLVGVFSRPVAVAHAAARCAHAAQGIAGCTRCLSACPAGAIESDGERIRVTAELCHACGACTLACPTGALTLVAPSQAGILERLSALVAAAADESPLPGVLILDERADENSAPPRSPGDPLLAFAVPRVAALGAEFWLGALARGVPRLAVQLPPALPAAVRRELESQLALARALLAALGEAPERIVLVDAAAGRRPARPGIDGEADENSPGPDENRRLAIEDAVDRLQQLHPAAAAEAALPPGSCFGTVDIDATACTLCLACAHLCPTGALAGDDARSLRFVEGQCVQCGICHRTCAEHALALRPRFLLDAAARRAERCLKADSRHRCPACDAPFVGRALLDRSLRLMREQRLLDPADLERLTLCPACRVAPR